MVKSKVKIAQSKVVIKKNKNVSQSVPNGTFIVTNDQYFYGTDGKSTKTRMAGVIDSNRNDELAIVKYTTSTKHGKRFKNNANIKGYADRIYTRDEKGKPIKIDGVKFQQGPKRRNITLKEANQIKKNNIKNSPQKEKNRANLRRLKHRKGKKSG